ncbi:MAG: hypothetical protein CVU11_02320 [Bacteroidetes bacterium HGW-Bacteroidetes-6]|nr:MAG: hypothetical protein CVU11_02320 [Bacteroidetes bacterium HGW-Bacteroidetes-6]
MKKNFAFFGFAIVLLLNVRTTCLAQTTLQTIDFESSGGYSTSVTEYLTSIDAYYTRLNYATNAGSISVPVSYTGYQGSWIFCMEDTGGPTETQTMTLSSVNITGYTSLQVKVLVAGQNNTAGTLETNKHMSFYANIDGGGDVLIGSFRGNGVSSYLYKDDNLNGSIEVGETTVLSSVFTEYTFNISGIGSNLVISTKCLLSTMNEEGAYDNLRVLGTLTVTNNAPTATAPSAPIVTEDATNVALADNIQVTDIDGDAQTVTFTVTGGTVSLGTTGITFGGGGNGSASFTASGTLAAINTALDAATFTPTANLFGVNAATISFTTNDGTVSSSAASVTFDIAAVNDAPTLSATGINPTFTEDASAAVLFSSASASTFESGQTIIGLTLTVTNVNDGTSEILNADGTSIVLTNGTSGTTAGNSLAYNVSVAGTTATVSFSGGSMTTAAVGTLINAMSYQNNSNNPNTSNRVVTITSIQDNGGTANSGIDVATLSIVSTVTVVAIDPPTIVAISPIHGPAVGGTSVTISGINFTGATDVLFGSSAAPFTVNSDAQITATSPIGTGVVNVTVTTAEGTSLGASYTYDAPTIVAISPNSGTTSGGTSVTISGLNFTGVSDVSFGATPASGFTVLSDGAITATSPAGSGAVNVTVTSPSGTSNSMTFTYIPTVSFTTTASNGLESASSADLQVDLSAISASVVTVDYTVTGTASGSGVDYTLANGTLTIAAGNTTANITIASIVDDVLIEGDETVIVTLSNPANATLGTNTVHTYTITDNDVAPIITIISPTHGPVAGGTTVTISGANFTGATNVSFGAAAATSFAVNSDNEIEATSPFGLGVVSLTVTTPVGTSNASTFTYDAPEIVSISPTFGTTAGGTSVTISGVNFTGATDVSFGANAATSFTVNSDDEITATSPAGSGAVNVTITSPGGTSNAEVFTYIIPTVAFTSTTSNGLESVGSADLQVELSEISASDVTVDYVVTGTASGSGVDYTLADGTLTITAGNTTANITIASIVDDALVEGDETVIVTLSNPANATLGTNAVHTYTIIDNDSTVGVSEISINDLSVYPNPCSDYLYLLNASSNISNIVISNLLGETVLLADYKGENRVDVSRLPSGVYLLIVENHSGEKQIIKIVKD